MSIHSISKQRNENKKEPGASIALTSTDYKTVALLLC
jgi:hypothetical protein